MKIERQAEIRFDSRVWFSFTELGFWLYCQWVFGYTVNLVDDVCFCLRDKEKDENEIINNRSCESQV